MEMETIVRQIDLQKLSLGPGDVLVVKLKGDCFTESNMDSLKAGFSNLFPNNKIVILCTPEGNEIELTAIENEGYTNIEQDCCGCNQCHSKDGKCENSETEKKENE
jgi:hypothetical protein